MEIKQYQVVLVDLNPTRGSEIQKTRPCLVISPNEMNKYLQTIIVAPMTTSLKNYPTRIPAVHNKKKGAVAIDQIRTIDKSRIIKTFWTITKKEIELCKKVLKETLVD
jgi:mRNA interferase MazF